MGKIDINSPKFLHQLNEKQSDFNVIFLFFAKLEFIGLGVRAWECGRPNLLC